METLFIFRDWRNQKVQTTTIKDKDGKVKQIITSALQQPKYGTETIVIRGKVYSLNWDNVKRNSKGVLINK